MNVHLLLGMAALWAVGPVGAAGLERLAYQGLVPPQAAAPLEHARIGSEPRDPGLKLPHALRGRGIQGLEILSGDAGRLLYGISPMSPRLGPGHARTVGGIYAPLAGEWSSTFETSVDAGPPSVRGYGLLGQVHRSLPGGWGLSLGLHYGVHDPGARLAGAWDQWPLTPHLSGAGTSSSAGYELRLNYRYGERNTLGFIYGSGSEFDYTRHMLGGYPHDGRQFGLTGEHWLTPDWALSYGLMAQEQAGPYRGQGLRLGLRYRF